MSAVNVTGPPSAKPGRVAFWPRSPFGTAISAHSAALSVFWDKQLHWFSNNLAPCNPDVFFNMGVNFLNAGATDDAVAYFGKAIALDPRYVDGYYRRALGYLGQGKTAEARADFQKVIELQGDGEMAEMSRKALESLK